MTDTLTIYADFICPFSFIAERSIIPQLRKTHPNTEIDWVGFEIHPETPKTPTALENEDYEELRSEVNALASKYGLHMVVPRFRPNTMKAHAFLLFAKKKGLEEQARLAVMNALWVDGKDISDDDVIREIAEALGLHANEAVEAANDHVHQLRVIKQRARCFERGITCTPTFWRDGRRVMGCQDIRSVTNELTIA